MADITENLGNTETAAKLRAVQAEANRLGDDVRSFGTTLTDAVAQQARENPLRTVAIALAVGWLIGRRA